VACRAMNNTAGQHAGRGDDVRQEMMSDITAPMAYPQIGPCMALVQMLLLLGSKTAMVRAPTDRML
jgi:hypothetical protein